MARIEATGGSISTYWDAGTEYKVHIFTADGEFNISSGSGDIEYLIVGGGGGASFGGGGGGGVLTGTQASVGVGSYPVVVGLGGAGASCATGTAACSHGTNGGDSGVFGLTAIGGGGGGNYGGTTYKPGFTGGSGGGGGQPSGAAGAGTTGQGYAGSAGNATLQSGGGGGAGGAAPSPASPNGTAGGIGVQSSITGVATYYGGGGGGFSSTTGATAGAGGLGGGGRSGYSTYAGVAGTANTGGGGGGDNNSPPYGAAGGSGIVVLRYVNIPLLEAYASITSPFDDTAAQAKNPRVARASLDAPFDSIAVRVNPEFRAVASLDSPFDAVALYAKAVVFGYAAIDSPFDAAATLATAQQAAVLSLAAPFDDLSVIAQQSGAYARCLESLTLGTLARGQPTYRLLDALALSVGLSTHLELSATLVELLQVSDVFRLSAGLRLSSSATFADAATVDVERILLLAETLAMTSGTAAVLEITQTLIEQLAFADLAGLARTMTASETLALADVVTLQIEALLSAQSTLALASQIRSSLVVVASDSLAMGDNLASTLEILLTAKDTLAFIGSLPLQDGDYQAWVMNTDTTGASSYTNFPMESLFTYKGVPYGLTSTGLYRLEGEDDDGTNIDALVATGDLNMGTMIEKSATHAYLYLTQNGEAVLRTITSRQGTRTETYYQVLDRTTESDDDVSYRKVKLGMGVKGTWWRFELASVDGASFDLDGAEVRYVALTRRGSWR